LACSSKRGSRLGQRRSRRNGEPNSQNGFDGSRGDTEIEGCSAQGVDADEMATLLASFWNGEIRDEGEMGERIRTTPLIGGMR